MNISKFAVTNDVITLGKALKTGIRQKNYYRVINTIEKRPDLIDLENRLKAANYLTLESQKGALKLVTDWFDNVSVKFVKMLEDTNQVSDFQNALNKLAKK